MNKWAPLFISTLIEGNLFILQPNNGSVQRHLSRGAWFGDSVLDDSPREATAVTRGQCKLLRVERRDFRSLWQVRLWRIINKRKTREL